MHEIDTRSRCLLVSKWPFHFHQQQQNNHFVFPFADKMRQKTLRLEVRQVSLVNQTLFVCTNYGSTHCDRVFWRILNLRCTPPWYQSSSVCTSLALIVTKYAVDEGFEALRSLGTIFYYSLLSNFSFCLFKCIRRCCTCLATYTKIDTILTCICRSLDLQKHTHLFKHMCCTSLATSVVKWVVKWVVRHACSTILTCLCRSLVLQKHTHLCSSSCNLPLHLLLHVTTNISKKLLLHAHVFVGA